LNQTIPIQKKSDYQLIEEYKLNKTPELIGELFKRYTQFVFLISMKYLKNEEESKDAVMQIFEKLFIDLKKHEVLNFKAWLHTVTKNHCLLKIRSNKSTLKKQEILKKDSDVVMENEPVLHLNLENAKEQLLNELEKAMPDLNTEQRICVDLFYLQEKTYSEISESTGFSLNQVKSYIQNGKRNLKIKLIQAGFSGSFILMFLLYK